MKKIIQIGVLVFICCMLFVQLDCVRAFDLPFGSPDGAVDPGELSKTGEEIAGSNDAGAKVLAGIFVESSNLIQAILGGIAVLWIIFTAVRMVINAGNDEMVKKCQTQITWGVIGLVVALLSEPMIKNVLFGGGETLTPGGVFVDKDGISSSIDTGTRQILAFLDWFKALVVTIAIAFLFFSGWSMVQALGEQEEVSKQKKTILWIAIGFLIIALNEVVINEVLYNVFLEGTEVQFEQSPAKGIEEFVGVVKFILKFVAVIAFVVLVWGGAQFIFGFADESRVENGKKIIKDALIGILVIVISYALVSTISGGSVG